jgi:hypothetical protein
MYLNKTVQECELNSVGSGSGPDRRPPQNILNRLCIPKNDGALDQLGKYVHLMKNLLCLQILGDPKSHIYNTIVLSQVSKLEKVTEFETNFNEYLYYDKTGKILITYYKVKFFIFVCFSE